MTFPGKNAVFTANDMGGDAETGPIPQVIVDSATSSQNGNSGTSYADQQMAYLLAPPAAGIALATGAAFYPGLNFINSVSGVTRVTSWAGQNIVPTLNGTRWVMTGGRTWLNYIQTGLWGPQISVATGTIYFNYVPEINAVTEDVSNLSLSMPGGIDWLKGFFLGQRIFTP